MNWLPKADLVGECSKLVGELSKEIELVPANCCASHGSKLGKGKKVFKKRPRKVLKIKRWKCIKYEGVAVGSL